MKTRRIFPGLLVLLLVLVAGCGGTSGGGGRRLSDVVAEDEKQGRESQRESRTRGDETRTRTRTDHQDDDGYGRHGSESDSGGSGGVLGWVFNAIFSGGDDEEESGGTHDSYREYEEPEPRAPAPYVEHEVGGENEYSEVPEETETGSSTSLGRFALGYRHGWSHLAGDAIEGFETSMVVAGFGPRDGLKIYLGGYFGHGDFGRANVAAALSDLTEEGLELGIRMYLTPDHTLLGPYFLMGGRIGSIDWKYRDPVEVTTEDGGVTRVVDDWVLDGGPFAGAGVSLLQTRRVHLGFSVMAGVRFTAGETDQGLVNDIFQDVGYVQWNLEGSFRF